MLDTNKMDVCSRIIETFLEYNERETGKMRRTINHNDLAVLVIDMQDYFLSWIDNNTAPLISAQQNVLRYAAREDVPVAVLEMKGYGPTVDTILEEAEKVPTYTFIQKTDLSGFRNTDLDKHLQKWKRRTLLLMGLYAGACVRETALGGRRKGYSVITTPQLIAERNDNFAEQALCWYRENYCLEKNYKRLLGI